ncbi:MAG: hypothetical protein ABJH85_05865 [Paracoccaceae bacterium]
MIKVWPKIKDNGFEPILFHDWVPSFGSDMEAKIMATNILITEKRNLSVKRELGLVSVMEATEQADAILMLREQAIELGANAVVSLCIVKALADPYFDATKVFVHGMAVEI